MFNPIVYLCAVLPGTLMFSLFLLSSSFASGWFSRGYCDRNLKKIYSHDAVHLGKDTIQLWTNDTHTHTHSYHFLFKRKNYKKTYFQNIMMHHNTIFFTSHTSEFPRCPRAVALGFASPPPSMFSSIRNTQMMQLSNQNQKLSLS
jgi:hypothetical protein